MLRYSNFEWAIEVTKHEGTDIARVIRPIVEKQVEVLLQATVLSDH